MNCSQFEDLFAAHIEGLLDGATDRQLEAHLSECSACRLALEYTRRLFRLLDDDARRMACSIAPAVMNRIANRQASLSRRNKILKLTLRFSIAAAAFIGLGLVALETLVKPLGGRIYAADLSAARKQIGDASTATWKISYYQRFQDSSGTTRRWFRSKVDEQQLAFKAPGLYRCENLDEDGEVAYVSIEDWASRAKLDINHKTRTATLTYMVESMYHPRGPFAKYLEAMRSGNLESIGKEIVAGLPANGFRYKSSPQQERSLDFWVHARTKQLVQCQDPGRDALDPAEIVPEPAWDVSSGDTIEFDGRVFEAVRGAGVVTGHIIREITFDVDLDDSLFALEPPAGYAVKTVELPSITEKDVLEFMGIVAEYFDMTFPEMMPQFCHSSKEEYERFTRAEQAVQGGSGALPAEMKLVEAMYRWWQTGIPGPGPMHVFITHQIDRGSWTYLGRGVKLGDQHRIVCWYRLRRARTYRVVYGDLSVKDVAPEDLPLPVK